MLCSGAAWESSEEVIHCNNEAKEVRRLTFGSWVVYTNLCEAHAELWDRVDEKPFIIKRAKKPQGNTET